MHKDVCLSLPASEGTVWESNGPDENAKDHVKTILAEARLYALVDCRRDEEAFAAMIAALVEGGVDVLQLRDKRVDDRMLLGRSEILQQIISKSERRVLFIMNDRPDLARLARADGVHVGQEELSVEQIKKIVGERMLIGVSTHDIEQVRRACLDGADYIGVGPVFASSTKHFDQTVGLEFLKQVFREMDSKAQMPAFAIGGISLDNLDDVLATGITRVAVGAALTEAENPRLAAQQFREGVLQAAETAREPEKPRPS